MKLAIFLTVTVSLCFAEELPRFIHACHKNEPNMQECIITAGDVIKEYLAKGVPEYDIPPLEPLEFKELLSEESAGLRIAIRDVRTWGCSDYHFKTVRIDVEKQIYDIDLEIPMLRIECFYNVSGKLLMMPIKGDGPMQSNVTDVKAKVLMKGEIYEKNGQQYLKYTKMTLKVTVGGGTVKLENLFNGDKRLNDVVNDAINKSLDTFLKEIMPIIEKALGSSLIGIANKIVENFTFQQIFPD